MTDPITHERAREIAQRFIDEFFDNPGTRRPNVSIPARPDHDDDLLLSAYIDQQENLDSTRPEPPVEPAREAYQDINGNPCSLDRLCALEPAWAANRIRVMTEALRSSPAQSQPDAYDYLYCATCDRWESAPFAPGDSCPLCRNPMKERPDADLAERLREAEGSDRFRSLYFDLLMQVGNVFEGETRHATAKRYIRAAENQDNPPADARKGTT